AYQGITEVVRGHDLLAFTPLQIYLCKILELPVPKFLHIPIITDGQGCKLSKQANAEAISKDSCSTTVAKALNDLGQETPINLAEEGLEQIWSWAIQHWDAAKIPRSESLPLV
ncbi:MAG: glutamate--tRNA ligase family protein, partial [Gammaproteobacteria bacterium]